MIRNIIFDVGFVLMDYSWKQKFAEMGYDEAGIRRLAENIFGGKQGDPTRMWQAYDMGNVSDDELREYIMNLLPQDKPAMEWFFGSVREWCRPMHDLVDLLPELKEKGYGIYLLSNYPRTPFTLQVDEQPWHVYVDGELVSSDVHYGKPERRFYEELFRRYSLKPEECLYLDDLPANTKAGAETGMQTITLDAPEKRIEAAQLLKSLKSL